MNILLEERLSPTTFANNIAMTSLADGELATELDAAETEAVSVDIYWRWEDDLTMEPQYLAAGTAGKTLQVPFKLGNRSIRLFMVSKTESGLASVDDVRDAEQTVVTAPSSGEQGIDALFAFVTDATTTGTASETLYDGEIAANTLLNNGEAVKFEAAGTFAANANDKAIFVEVGGMQIGDATGTAYNNVDWSIDGMLIREDADTLKFVIEQTVNNAAVVIDAGKINSLDFTGVIDFTLRGRTPTNAGDLTAYFWKAYKLPAAPVSEVANAVEFLAEDVTFLSEVVTFSP